MRCRWIEASIAVLIALVFAGVSVMAAEESKGALGGTRGSSQAVSGGSKVRPLKGEIRLSPGLQRGVGRLMPQQSFDSLQKKYGEFSGNAQKYEYGAAQMPVITKECATKAYSVQDQKAAGCTDNDTLKQCMEKLYKHCVEHWSVSFNPPTGGDITGVPKQGGFHWSTAEFKVVAPDFWTVC